MYEFSIKKRELKRIVPTEIHRPLKKDLHAVSVWASCPESVLQASCGAVLGGKSLNNSLAFLMEFQLHSKAEGSVMLPAETVFFWRFNYKRSPY